MITKKLFHGKEKPTGVQCSVIRKGNSFTSTRRIYDWVALPREDDDEQSRDSSSQVEDREEPLPPTNRQDIEQDADVYMHKRAKALPLSTGRFGNNHVLINKERVKRNIRPLIRDQALDSIALAHAKEMAAANKLLHSEADVTIAEILRTSNPCRVIGENVTKQGGTRYLTRTAHNKLFANSSADRKNMLDERYTSLGVGSQVSDTGVVYICQIYKG
mmetsp:Transcript_1031/g.1614  ORF Transcript_1031/g.1614 Transcript_1031/m.1614 type:complete len:217 (+) Transcript_1031:106-756(+)